MLVTCGCTGNGGEDEPVVLNVVAAGSVLGPLGEVEAAFEADHPGVDVRVEGHGSIQCIRQVTDLHRDFDVVIVADETLIPDMMYREDERTGEAYADSYTPFARNAVVVAYTPQSRYGDAITAENWYEVLSRPDVRVGFSNPMLDAAGYRALMVLLLAEEYYGEAGLFAGIAGDHCAPALTVTETGGVQRVTLPEVLEPDGTKLVIRDGSIFLLSHLESGGIDYAFEYKSVAEEHGLQYISLPPAIDLSTPVHAENYRTVEVTLGFQRFSSIGSVRTGVPVVYGVVVPAGATNPALAEEFAGYVTAMFGEGGYGWPAVY
ncbi:tungstate ABC transporter substrate-binding protein WtpA [Methanomicrobiaceae archaeon CYW5]|nr:tungstate ABC transporter substrate-binding protein WtpA [Methanovulcanius yangii]